MKTKTWILLLTVLALVCAGLSFVLLRPGQSDFAEVWSDGKLLYTLDLRIDQTVTVESSRGINTITVSGGAVAVTDASCPDGYCMDRGFCAGGAQIVCLPNRLVIRFTGVQTMDGISG